MNFLAHVPFFLSFSVFFLLFLFRLFVHFWAQCDWRFHPAAAMAAHTHTRILQAPFCCQVWCVFVCVLSAFRRAWLVLALALAIYSAVCCDPTSFCGFSTVVDSQTGCAGIGLRPGGQRSCLCVACHIFVLFAFLTCSLIDRLRPFLLSPIHVCFLISFHVNYGYKRWLISFYIP